MVVFRNKDDNPEKWKEKYLNLLDSAEQLEKEYKSNEDLLCKTIIRFALAVKGINKALDPHLDNIRNLLKSGLQSQKLKTELQSFSNALLTLEEAPPNRHVNADLLFEFLCRQYPDNQAQLVALQDRYDQGEFKEYQALFIAILEVIDDERYQSESAFELPEIENNLIRSHLSRLLEFADIPEMFAAETEHLKSRLQAELVTESLGSILEDTVTLLLRVKKILASEQLEMADFLSKLTEQLSDLAVKASGVNIATENVIKKRNLLDETVSEQMANLQIKSANATQLEPLKQLVHSHLSTISLQIQAHGRQEQIEREELKQELMSLTQKVCEMEAETGELKSKLDVAQHKAAQDALTRLPNRQAFEDRLRDELARWRRQGLPLSMIVWDIDYFKKINDNYGHKSGDKALIAIAQLLAKQCRETDFVARFGGEEFVMLLPDTTAQTALNVANKLRENVEKANFRAAKDKISITLSCGISQAKNGDTNESLFERADNALYKAKESGRNQCVVI